MYSIWWWNTAHWQLSFWVSLVVATFAHELGHIFFALVLGVRIRRIGIGWMGPYIKRADGTPTENIIIALGWTCSEPAACNCGGIWVADICCREPGPSLYQFVTECEIERRSQGCDQS